MAGRYDAIAGLHAKVFANYENWIQRLELLPGADEKLLEHSLDDNVPCISLANWKVTISDFASLHEGAISPPLWSLVVDAARQRAQRRRRRRPWLDGSCPAPHAGLAPLPAHRRRPSAAHPRGAARGPCRA